MASVDMIAETTREAASDDTARAESTPPLRVLVCLSASASEPDAEHGGQTVAGLMEDVAAQLRSDRPNSQLMVAFPTYDSEGAGAEESRGYKTVSYAASGEASTIWMHSAEDFRRAANLMKQNNCTCCVMLGAEAQSIVPDTISAMIHMVIESGCDLAVPRYLIDPDEGVFNSAMLYPLSRSLFGSEVRTPLALDIAMSSRMIERMGAATARIPTGSQANSILWPVAEAAVAGYSMGEVIAGRREEPLSPDLDLKAALALVAGSLFADIEAKASYWQRNRPAPLKMCSGEDVRDAADSLAGFSMDTHDADPLINSFRLAYGNLHEIWSLVLPPNSLLGLKKLSLMSTETFRMSDALWVRIVYDFALAHRLRTINRGHLLGALTPLYLAWVASYILQCKNAEDAQRCMEALALAFEADKPYLVSRWRWPDRFNP
jgi:glucosylglycerate synthase